MARTPKRADPGVRCQVLEVEGARTFVTIGQDDPRWTLGWSSSADVSTLGAFVRLEPPPDASDETIAKMRREAERKALKVVVLPRRRSAAVLAPKERRPHRKAREVVAELVAESPHEDKEALDTFVEAVMARRGI